MNSTTNAKHIVLLGASVGKAWNIQQLSDRISHYSYHFEYCGLYQFDKTSALERLLRRNQDKPNAIFLKECAAYFPGDITFEMAKTLMQKWITHCSENRVVPIPTTVCPITRMRDEKFKTHNSFKRLVKKIRGTSMQTCMDRIREYNDWIKSYAGENHLAVLDLEAALRISDQDRYLRDDMTKGDGLHLNKRAYHLLDQIVIPTLEQVNWETGHNT